MEKTVAEIAAEVGGELEGDGSAVVTGVAALSEAGKGDITFLANQRYAAAVSETRATAILVGEEWSGTCPCAVIRVKNADEALARAAAIVGPAPVAFTPGVHPTAVVAADAELGPRVSIGPHCVLEPGVRVAAGTVLAAGCYLGHGTVVGEDCRLYPYVSTRERTRIGDRVVIHNGAVVGSDGFGYVRTESSWLKIPQVGVVEIGDDVEIGANATIDRARFGRTIIGNGVKIDNLVQVAHNVNIGEGTAIAAQVALAGSVTVGKNVQIGGQAAIAGHLTVGDNAIIGGQSGVTKDVEANTFVFGFPAMPHNKARRLHAHMMRLPQMRRKIAEIEMKLAELPGGEK